MNKYLATILYCTFVFNAQAQKHIYQGTYRIGGKSQESAYQLLTIHCEKQGAIFFYLEVGRGAPNYNSGAKYGRLMLNKQNGHLQYLPIDTMEDCSLEFIKNGSKITVKTIHGDCPFGYGVYADGDYSIKSSFNPVYFTDRHRHKIYFSKTPPENYLE